MALSEGSKERVRLEADFLNTLAGNIFAIGVVAPLIGWAFGVDIPATRHTLTVAIVLVCFGGALVLHFIASTILRKIDR